MNSEVSNPPPNYTDTTGAGWNKEYPVDVKEDTHASDDDECEINVPPTEGHKIFNVEFAKKSYHMDYLIKEENLEPLYYCDNKQITASLRGGKPDVIFHKGGDVSGPIVGASRSNIWGTKHEVCFGDPDTSNEYTELHVNNVVSMTCTWSPSNSSKKYTWKRIHGKEAQEHGGRKSSLLSIKLVDDETGETVALYLNNGPKNWRTAGVYKIKIDEKGGDEWYKAVLLTGCVLTEKERRNRRWMYSSGGHGGP